MLFAIPVCVLIGCAGSSVVGEPDHGGDNLFKLGAAYDQATRHNNRPPKSVQELKAFAPDLDQYLVSPNDQKPYVILWGVDPRAVDAMTVIGYESRGSNGFRYVLTASGVRKLNGTDFRGSTFPAGHKPPAD